MLILAKLIIAEKRPKLDIQLPIAGDDNQICQTIMVIFNQIYRLCVTKYNFYSSTVFFTNVFISTLIRGCDLSTTQPNYWICSSLISSNSACQENSKSIKKEKKLGNDKTKEDFWFSNDVIWYLTLSWPAHSNWPNWG